MASLSAALKGVWAADAQDLFSEPPPLTTKEALVASPTFASPSHPLTATCERIVTPYGVSLAQLEALAAMAYLVGSPLQRQQPSGGDVVHPALLVAAKLLQQGVDPERVIQLVECRYDDMINR